jgi:CheY-like chemotaxis protein
VVLYAIILYMETRLSVPQIGIFDDNKDIRLLGKLRLKLAGYNVPDEATATNIESAKQVIQNLKIGKLALQAVLLDANLSSGFTDGKDGRYIANCLHALEDRPLIIGFSVVPMSVYGVTVDFDAKKDMTEALRFLDQHFD